MDPTFDRFRVDYSSEYERWRNWPDVSSQLGYRAVARNMMHDPRVSYRREDRFDEHYRNVRPLENGLSTYFAQYVRGRNPDFLDPLLNADNFVAGALGANLIDHDTELVTFLDLSGLGLTYQWATAHPYPDYEEVFESYSNVTGDDAIGAWLEETISLLGVEAVVRAVLAAKRAIRADAKYRYHNPVWVGLWDELATFIETSSSDRWFQLVGVYRSASKRWIAPLRYSVFAAGTLVRPSVLDAGFYPYHFPSPRSAPLRDGGCCMDLALTGPGSRLVHEYIHQEIDFQPEYWEAAGAKCSATLAASPDNLLGQRRTHHALLVINYAEVAEWMSEPI